MSSKGVVCAIYTRVQETAEGADEQSASCRKLAASKGWSVPNGFVFADIDSGVSTLNERPGMSRLLQELRSPKVPFQGVLVDGMFRISRNSGELASFFEALHERGVWLLVPDAEEKHSQPNGLPPEPPLLPASSPAEPSSNVVLSKRLWAARIPEKTKGEQQRLAALIRTSQRRRLQKLRRNTKLYDFIDDFLAIAMLELITPDLTDDRQ